MIATCPLGSVVAVSAGQPAPKGDEFSNEGMPFIRAGSLDNLLNGGTLADCEKIPETTARKNRLRLYPKDTVVFAKSGMSATLGRVYRLPEPAYVVSHLATLVPTGKYDPRYLTYWLRRNPPSHLIKDPAYPSIRTSEIEQVEVPNVPLSQQERIAAILDKADGIRRKREQAQAMSDELLKSTFLEMFGGPNHPNPALRVLALGEICDLFAGNSLPPGEAYSGQDTGLLLLKVADLNLPGNDQIVTAAREWVSEKGSTRAAIIAPKNAIVFPKRGGAIATNKKRVLGRPSVLDPNLMAVAPKKGAPITYPYLRMWFELLDLTSISNGSTVPQLNKGDLHPLKMAVPERVTLAAFERVFQGVRHVHHKHAADTVCSEALFSTLSQRAFRGEL